MTSLRLEFDVSGNNFASAGTASDEVKKKLKMLGISPVIIRKVAIAMYEGEINMVIHAGGGKAIVDIYEFCTLDALCFRNEKGSFSIIGISTGEQ